MNRFQHAWYWPHDDDRDILRIGDSRPCEADVSSLSSSSADLVVHDHIGRLHVRLNIPVHPDGPGRDWCLIA